MNEIIEKVMEMFGTTPALATAYVIIGALIGVMAVVCIVLEVRVYLKYRKANKIGSSTNMTGIGAARFALDHYGMQNVKVRKAGVIREMLFGNYYNILTKTIYLRSCFGKIDKKKTVTSTALGVQKAAVAKLCESGDKQARTRNSLSLLGVFGPILFIPVILAGTLIDMIVMKDITMISYICFAVAGVLLISGFIVTLLNIPVEKRANRLALKMMAETGLATDEELDMIRDVYDAYILSYIAQFILEVLRVVQWVLEIVMSMNSKSTAVN